MSVNVPLIRFKEFTEEWEVVEFNQVFEEVNERTSDTDNYPLYSLTLEKGVTPKSERYERSFLIKKDEDNYKIVKNDEFVYNPMNLTLGAVAKYSDRQSVSVSGYYNVFRTKEGFSSGFFDILLKTSKMLLQYKAIATGSLIEKQRVHFSQFVKIKRPIPTYLEQKKIADFFELIDQKIEKQQEKIEQLEMFKKGVLQKIFSREIRFKDENGQEFPQWGTVRLGDLGETYGGLSGKTKEDFGDGECSFITYMNVFTNTIAQIDGLEKVSVGVNEKQNDVKAGDILFTTSSETPEEVGMASVWSYDIPNVYLNSFCFGFRMTKSVDPVFLAYLLRSGVYRKHITMLAQGSTRYNLSKRNLMEMEVSIPQNVEQKLIRDFFIKLDSKLAMETKKLNLLDTMKRGFMQQMIV